MLSDLYLSVIHASQGQVDIRSRHPVRVVEFRESEPAILDTNKQDDTQGLAAASSTALFAFPMLGISTGPPAGARILKKGPLFRGGSYERVRVYRCGRAGFVPAVHISRSCWCRSGLGRVG
jgi:hypothetical protein